LHILFCARVSTDEQNKCGQAAALRGAGCTVIIEDTASGGSRYQPNLAPALRRVGGGNTLIVVRIDRLARSLSHLLEIVETLGAKGAYFRSIHDPIDTSSAQGMLMTQMLDAFAEFKRSLIRERTRAGLKAAVARGAKLGRSKMRARSRGDRRRPSPVVWYPLTGGVTGRLKGLWFGEIGSRGSAIGDFAGHFTIDSICLSIVSCAGCLCSCIVCCSSLYLLCYPAVFERTG